MRKRIIVKRSNEPTQCRNRGDAVDTRENQTCGCRGKSETVYACPEYGMCTLRKYKLNQPEAVCLTCDKREP